MPRKPKRRTIDIRAGDQVLCMGEWRPVLAVAAFRWSWISEESARGWEPETGGYVYHPVGQVERLELGPGGKPRELDETRGLEQPLETPVDAGRFVPPMRRRTRRRRR